MAVCPFRRGVASSESESIFSLEGRLATLERVSAGDSRARRRLPRWFEGVRMGRTVYLGRGLGFFEFFTFLSFGLEGGCRPSWARLPNMCLCF